MNPICCPVQFGLSRNGRKGCPNRRHLRIPTLSRAAYPAFRGLMALAIRFDELIAKGDIKNYAELARLGHITRARVTQIMNLLHLAPDIQEQVLFLPRHSDGPRPDQTRRVAAADNGDRLEEAAAVLAASGPRQETMKCTLISGELMGPRFYCDRNWPPCWPTCSRSRSVRPAPA